MELKKLAEGLSKLERQVLPFLDKYNDIKTLEQVTKLKEVEIVRALQWLENKKLITIKEDQKQLIDLDKNEQIICIEILSVSKRIPKNFLSSVKVKNISLEQ